MTLQVPLSQKSCQHQHVERHRVVKIVGTLGYISRAANLQSSQQAFRISGERHDVEVFAWDGGGLELQTLRRRLRQVGISDRFGLSVRLVVKAEAFLALRSEPV
jgi:hypothetical protein